MICGKVRAASPTNITLFILLLISYSLIRKTNATTNIDAVTIVNNSGSSQTITQGAGLSLYNTADASTGNKTLSARGMATVWFSSANAGYISGNLS